MYINFDTFYLNLRNIFVTKASNYVKGVCERHENKQCAV
jgi:hypothetical protein